MREIKFRNFDIDNKSWFYTDHDKENGMIWFWENVKNYNTIIEQYTGLKDKNGKEIYEGDILGNDPDYGVFVISWDSLNAKFTAYDNMCTKYTSNLDFVKHQYIIGNIHENSELITQP